MLRHIVEQSTEWNIIIYIAFIYFENALSSLNRKFVYIILRHYDIPQKMVDAINILYIEMKGQGTCDSNLTDSFGIRFGVKQGCVLPPPFLFILAIDSH